MRRIVNRDPRAHTPSAHTPQPTPQAHPAHQTPPPTPDHSPPPPTTAPPKRPINPSASRTDSATDTIPPRPANPTSALTTQRHHPRRILQRQPTRHKRRRDLPLRMTHHRIRLHTQRTPQLRQRHHHRKQHRLHHINPLQRRRTTHTPQHILNDQSTYGAKRPHTPTNPLREHRRRPSNNPTAIPAHCDTLTRKHKHDRPTRHAPAHRPAASPAANTRKTAPTAPHDPRRAPPRGARQRGASRWPAYATSASRKFRPRHAARRAAARPGPADRLRATTCGRAPRRRSDAAGSTPAAAAAAAIPRLGGRLLQDDMRVGAADPERRDARPGAAARRPRPETGSVSSRPAPADQSTCGEARPRAASLAAPRAASPSPS